MKYRFHVDKVYTAAITMEFPTDDEDEAEGMARDWLEENWDEVECDLACVQFVNDYGEKSVVCE